MQHWRTKTSPIIMNLDKQLEQWRENFPAFQAHRLPPRGEHLSVLRLYFTYHNCVISIHRMNGRRYWLPHDEPTPRPPSDILCSMERCVEAARMLLKLLDLVPCTLTSFYWDILGFSANALVVLFIHILHQPHSTHAASDLQAMKKGLGVLPILKPHHGASYIPQAQIICGELCRLAQAAIESSSQKEPHIPAASSANGTHKERHATQSSPAFRSNAEGFSAMHGYNAPAPGSTNFIIQREPQGGNRNANPAPMMWDKGGGQYLNALPFPCHPDDFAGGFLNLDPGLNAELYRLFQV